MKTKLILAAALCGFFAPLAQADRLLDPRILQAGDDLDRVAHAKLIAEKKRRDKSGGARGGNEISD